MPVSKAFKELVLNVASKGYHYDALLRIVRPRIHLDSYLKDRLRRTAIEQFGFKTDIEADAAIREILRQVESVFSGNYAMLDMANLEKGTLISFALADGTILSLLYNGGNDFIVISDSSGVLRPDDRMSWLCIHISQGEKLRGTVYRNGMPYPDSDKCFVSENISEIYVTLPGFEDETAGSDLEGGETVVKGSRIVYSRCPTKEGYFLSSSLCDLDENPLFEINLGSMEYVVAGSFSPGKAVRSEVEQAIGYGCEITVGDNPLRVKTAAPGFLKAITSSTGLLLQIQTKLQVRLD